MAAVEVEAEGGFAAQRLLSKAAAMPMELRLHTGELASK